MAVRTPKTLIDTFEQEGKRLLDYLNLDKIAKAKDPYKEFLNQFTSAFGKDNGLNLFPYVENKYNVLNTLYKTPELQNLLPKQFKGPLKRAETREFWTKEKRTGELKKIEKRRERKLAEIGPFGRKIYNKRQEVFLLKNKDLGLKNLTKRFNEKFGQDRTYYAIRDKLARLEERKK